MRHRNKGEYDSAVHRRAARRCTRHVRRRNLGGQVVRPAEAARDGSRGVQSKEGCSAKRWQQGRSYRRLQTSGTVVYEQDQVGVSRRARLANDEGAGTQLSDHQCRSHAGHGLKSLYRSWGIPCVGTEVYAPRYRAEWLGKIREAGVRRRAEYYYQQLDVMHLLRQKVRKDLLAESRKHKAWRSLMPCELF